LEFGSWFFRRMVDKTQGLYPQRNRGVVMSKALMATGALVAFLALETNLRADQPAQTPATVVVPVAPAPPVQTVIVPGNPVYLRAEPAVPPGKPSLCGWLFNKHPKAYCPGCAAVDPDFGCSTCEDEWIFLFGSCRAFYGEPRHWKHN
jgi:hypothetical protein